MHKYLLKKNDPAYTLPKGPYILEFHLYHCCYFPSLIWLFRDQLFLDNPFNQTLNFQVLYLDELPRAHGRIEELG